MDNNDETKNRAMEQLKAAVLKDIELQTQVRKKFNLILIILSAIFLFTSITVIYLTTRPVSANQVTLKYIENLQQNLLEQQKLEVQDREDIREARIQTLQIQNKLLMSDSIRKQEKDSFYYLP